MKNLVLSALVLAAVSQAAGCIIVSDDEDTGNANVSWRLLSTDAADPNGADIPGACPEGATRAVIYAQAASGGAPFEDRWLCNDLAGFAEKLPADRYTMWVRLTDESFTTRYAETASQIVDVPAGGTVTVPTYDLYVDRAFYVVGWNLRDDVGAAIPCSNVDGENGVSITATDAGGGLWNVDVDCEEGLAPSQTVTEPIPSSLAGPGAQYTVAVSLLNAQNQSIGDAPAITPSPDRALNYGGEYQDLGIVDIGLR